MTKARTNAVEYPGARHAAIGSSHAASGASAGASAPVTDRTAPDRLRRLDQLRPLAHLKPYILRYPRMVLAALAALVVSALTMLVVPLAVRRMIDVGFVGADGRFINSYFLAIVGLGLMLAVASASRFYAVNWLGERVVADLRADVFRHLLSLGAAFHDRNRTGELMSRLTADTTQLKSAAGSSLSQALRNSIMLLGALTMMVVTSPLLTMIVLVGLIGVVVPLLAAGRAVRARSRGAQDTLADAAAYAQENLSAIRTVQSSATENHVAGRFAVAVEKSFDAARERLAARAFLTAGTIALIVTCLVAILWFGATRVVAGDMTGGRLGQFILYALFAGGAVAELAEVWGELSQAAGAAERLADVLDTPADIKAPVDPLPLPTPARGTVAFDGVSFAYSGRADRVLHDVSFQIQPGETVALVGPSGSGKSTVLALLQRFYDPASGAVRIDGIAASRVDPQALRGRMALVPQDIAIFADTISANIRYGRPDASDAEVRDASRLARVDRFVDTLPDGYETLVGERGVTLSGGQRQRIGIARAILRDAPILLLDEATSALDAENEAEVQAALEAVMAGRTTLVIAHRLATVKKADRILVLDEGRIVEQGSHASLVAAGGLYARLASLQFLDVAAAAERTGQSP